MKKLLPFLLLLAGACSRVEAPAPVVPLPDARKMAGQRLET